jgi:hypothetical protein
VREGRGRFVFIRLSTSGRRRLRCGGYACEDRRRRPKRTVTRSDLATLNMRAQPTIITLERSLAPKTLHTYIALGAATSTGEKATREEKVERAPPAGRRRGRAQRRCGPGAFREYRAGFDEREAVYERWREGRTAFGSRGDGGDFFFRGGVVGCYGDCGTTLSQVELGLGLGLSRERTIWRRIGSDWGGADCEDRGQRIDGRVT